MSALMAGAGNAGTAAAGGAANKLNSYFLNGYLDFEGMMQMVSSPECSSSPAHPPTAISPSSSITDFDLGLLTDASDDFQVPSPALSALEAAVLSPTMFSPGGDGHKSPVTCAPATPTCSASAFTTATSATSASIPAHTKRHHSFSHGSRHHPYQRSGSFTSTSSSPSPSPYSPLTSAVRGAVRLSSTETCSSVSSPASSVNDFPEMHQRAVKMEQTESSVSYFPPPPPYNATQATVQIKIEALEPRAAPSYYYSPAAPSAAAMVPTASTSRAMHHTDAFGARYATRPFDFTLSSGFPPSCSASWASSSYRSRSIKTEDEEEEEEVPRDDMGEVIMGLVGKEILTTSKQLQISTDPSSWSARDVYAWLEWTMQQYGIPAHATSPQVWTNVDGHVLARMSEEDFANRISQRGNDVYAQFEIWRSTAMTSQTQQPEPLQGDLSSVQQQQRLTYGRDDYALHNLDTPSTSAAAAAAMTAPFRTSPPSYPFEMQPPVMMQEAASTSEARRSPDTSSEEGDEIDDDDVEASPPSGVGATSATGRSATTIHLWQFMKELLNAPHLYSGCIHWLDRERGVFKIVDSGRVAALWGRRKNRPAMNYDKLSRSLRQYYKKGIMRKTERTQRLVYQFCHPYHL